MVKIDNVFLIDDSEIFNFMHAKAMEKAGFAQKVRVFDNATSALEILKQLPVSHPENFPDVIFLDISMPEMDGWEFLDSIVDLSTTVLTNCRIYILTSSIDENDVAHSKQYDMVSDFISKPLTPERLQAISVEPHSTSKRN